MDSTEWQKHVEHATGDHHKDVQFWAVPVIFVFAANKRMQIRRGKAHWYPSGHTSVCGRHTAYLHEPEPDTNNEMCSDVALCERIANDYDHKLFCAECRSQYLQALAAHNIQSIIELHQTSPKYVLVEDNRKEQS